MLPPPPGTSIPGVVAPCVAGIAIGVILWLTGPRTPSWAIPVVLAFGTVLISIALYYGSDLKTGGQIVYLWIAVYAFYVLSFWVAIAEIAFVAASYGALLLIRHEPTGGARWAITVATLVIIGLFIARVVAELEALFRRTIEREADVSAVERRFRSAFEDAAVGMALVGLDGRWFRVNEALARITGYRAEQLNGMSFRDLTPAEDVSVDDKALERLVSGKQATHHAEKRYVRADGTMVWVQLSVSVVRDADGNPQHLISQMQDITARKAAEEELAKRALHDPLTGLPNRRLFTDRVELAVARIERSGAPIGVFFIDLDRFKLVNDSLGHAAGDRLLVAVADRLRAHVRPSDTVSRFGGDEFTVLCENTDEQTARRVAERILECFSTPFPIGDRELFISASIGITICHEPGTPAESMMRDADAAMYLAKDEGGSGFTMFHGGMRQRATARLELENDLRRALEHDEFHLVYQADVDLKIGRMVGVEALLRWRHPQRGLLGPGQFIGAAEESGLIVPIGAWVIWEACRQARAWQSEGHELTVAINISPRQLADESLPEELEAALSATGATPRLLTLEITETAAIRTPPPALEALRKLGVRLALDDFGAGFSSLNQIRSLPTVDTLKIDRLFTEELGNRPADTAIVAAIIQMAGAMGIETVAEGIETELQARLVKKLGCDRGQGYHFGRPMSAAELAMPSQIAPGSGRRLKGL